MAQETVGVMCMKVEEPIAHGLQCCDLLADGAINSFLPADG